MIELFDTNIDRYIYAILIFTFFQFFRVGLRQTVYKITKKTTSTIAYDCIIFNAIFRTGI